MRLRPILVAAATAAATAVSMATPAQAAPVPVVENLVGPLSFSVDGGSIVVAQSFAGKLSQFPLNGTAGHDLFVRNPKIDIGAVDASGAGTLFSVTGKTPGGVKFAQLAHLGANGKKTTWANLRAFEVQKNPDHATSYGFRDLSSSCAAKVPDEVGGKPYQGKVDSHPYATARLNKGAALVADAAGNDLLRATKTGKTSVVAVFPAQPLKITKAIAAGLHIPACAAGHKFYFEAVPTDVEVRGHQAYVTTLPGGPEDPSLGARGKVYRVNLRTGHVKLLAKHFLGATGVAVSPAGKVYVAELFGNRISTISHGKRKTVLSTPGPAAIEWHNGRLFFTSNSVTPPGSILRWAP
jgi:hypothetical protein